MRKTIIRMATREDTHQRHTIVGGRPAGITERGKGIPRSMEVLIKKAAIDEKFFEDLLAKRALLADELRIPLDPSERAMLTAIPDVQLRQIIRHTNVPETQKPFLIAGSTAALLALLAQLTFAPLSAKAENANASPGTQVTQTEEYPNMGTEGGIRSDANDFDYDRTVSGGILPDVPEPREPDDIIYVPASDPLPFTLGTDEDPILKSEVNGKSFREAIDILSAETGVKLTFTGMEIPESAHSVTVKTRGLPLGKALRKICQEIAGDSALYEMEVDGKRVTIKFRRTSSANPAPQPVTEQAVPVNPIKPGDAMTRGIRPDFPQTKGIRPDRP